MDTKGNTLIAMMYAWLLAQVELLAETFPTKTGRLQFQLLHAEHARAQAGAGNLISLVIGIAVAVIVAVGVAIPITQQVINQSNLTGLTAMIVGFIPVMLGVLVFVATVGPIMARS